MKKDKRKTELDNGIVIIPDDTPQKKEDEIKRAASRRIKRASEAKEKKRIPSFVYIIVIAVIFIIVFVAADISSGGYLADVNGKFVSAISRSSSQKFAASSNGDTVYAFEPYDDGYAVLTENGVFYIGSSGKTKAQQQLTFSSPSMEICRQRSILFDRGGSSYALFRGSEMYAKQSSPSAIIDAAVSKKENYVLAVRDENAKSILYGFNSSGKIIYQWNCPDGYISDAAVTPSGGKAAVTVLDAENAVLSSKVYILDFEYDSPYAELNFTDETVIGVKFISSSKLQVITDKKVYLVKGREPEIVYEYGSASIAYCDMSYGSYTALVTDDYTKDDSYILTIFSKRGSLLSTAQLSGKVKGVSASGKSVSVLYADKTETYSKRGKLVGSVSDINYCEDIVLNGNYIYLLSSDSVKKYPAYGEITASYTEAETQ